jgi:hypothetical protein
LRAEGKPAVIDDYRFASLFARAVSEWPQTISAEAIQRYNNGISVNDLFELYENLSEKYRGADDEVVMDALHLSIYSVLLESAVHQVRLRPSELRRFAVRTKFEERLRSSMAAADLNWNNLDHEMAREYFQANKRRE